MVFTGGRTMYKNIMIAIVGISVLASAGCASGPLRRFFRGGACNACQPAMGQTLWGQESSDDSESCPNGVCGQSPESLGGTVLPGPAQSQPAVPNNSGVIYGQPNFDPFYGNQIVTPPANGTALPGPR